MSHRGIGKKEKGGDSTDIPAGLFAGKGKEKASVITSKGSPKLEAKNHSADQSPTWNFADDPKTAENGIRGEVATAERDLRDFQATKATHARIAERMTGAKAGDHNAEEKKHHATTSISNDSSSASTRTPKTTDTQLDQTRAMHAKLYDAARKELSAQANADLSLKSVVAESDYLAREAESFRKVKPTKSFWSCCGSETDVKEAPKVPGQGTDVRSPLLAGYKKR